MKRVLDFDFFLADYTDIGTATRQSRLLDDSNDAKRQRLPVASGPPEILYPVGYVERLDEETEAMNDEDKELRLALQTMKEMTNMAAMDVSVGPRLPNAPHIHTQRLNHEWFPMLINDHSVGPRLPLNPPSVRLMLAYYRAVYDPYQCD